MTGETLTEQGVAHNVKAMVLELRQSEEDARRHFQVEEGKQNEARLEERRIQRTRRGLEILAERGAHSFRLVHSRPRGGCENGLGSGVEGWGYHISPWPFFPNSLTFFMSPSLLFNLELMEFLLGFCS